MPQKTKVAPPQIASIATRINAWFMPFCEKSFASLVERWADEWQYESLNDYEVAIRAALPHGVSFVHMATVQDRLGFYFRMDGDTTRSFKAYATKGRIQWRETRHAH